VLLVVSPPHASVRAEVCAHGRREQSGQQENGRTEAPPGSGGGEEKGVPRWARTREKAEPTNRSERDGWRARLGFFCPGIAYSSPGDEVNRFGDRWRGPRLLPPCHLATLSPTRRARRTGRVGRRDGSRRWRTAPGRLRVLVTTTTHSPQRGQDQQPQRDDSSQHDFTPCASASLLAPLSASPCSRLFFHSGPPALVLQSNSCSPPCFHPSKRRVVLFTENRRIEQIRTAAPTSRVAAEAGIRQSLFNPLLRRELSLDNRPVAT
jgi:hypothetical protein